MMDDPENGRQVDRLALGWHPAILWARSRSAIVGLIGAIAAAGILFVLYHHLAATATFDSDLGFLPLQAYDVLRGNPTADGWIGPQNSFLFTELPVYVVAVAVHGLSPTVVNVVSAAYYTLTALIIVAMAAVGLLRKQQPLAMLVAFGLIAAPTSPYGVYRLIAGPNHTGTALFVFGGVLSLHLSHRGARIALSLLALLLLTLAIASDPLALFVGVLPLAAVHGLRLAGRLPRGAWDDGPDFAVAVMGGLLGLLTLSAIPAVTGYQLIPVPTVFASLFAIPAHTGNALDSWLHLFGAQVLGQPLTILTGGQLFRLLGYVFTVAACVVVTIQSVRQLHRNAATEASDPLVLSQTLLAMVAFNVLAVIFSTNGAIDDVGRYLVTAVLAGAALSGRAAPTMLTRVRWRAAAALVSICYIALLPLSLRYPAAALPESGLVTWLKAHNLNHGLAEYWSASVVTVSSGNKVQIRAVAYVNGKLGPYLWVVKPSWYGSGAQANFVVIDSRPNTGITEATARATFGSPAYESHVDAVTVMVWNHNILPELGPGVT